MDDFEFDARLKSNLEASVGFGSRVTEREGMKGGDRSVTVSVAEKAVLHKFYSDFPRMSLDRAREGGKKADFEIRSFPSGEPATVSINHPKESGGETRLYFKKGVFHPEPGDFWFLFERNGELWIGSLEEPELKILFSGGSFDAQDGTSGSHESDYQRRLNAGAAPTVTTTSTRTQRDPAVGHSALRASGYKCEMLPDHPLFESKRSGAPYLEAHHFFPMMEQRHFPDVSLDIIENICILNPYAHKMVHHATYSEIEGHLKKMAEPREDFLKDIGVSVDRVLRCYGGS